MYAFFCQIRKKQPVVFLPNSNDGKDCVPSGNMSSFGYLSFVLSLINAVVNAANNVNNNQVRNYFLSTKRPCNPLKLTFGA